MFFFFNFDLGRGQQPGSPLHLVCVPDYMTFIGLRDKITAKLCDLLTDIDIGV
jgi:hypothetical protein